MPSCVRCASEIPALTVFCPQCQHPNEPDFKQLIHQTFDNRFQLYRQLSEGGLSTVFAAIDLNTDKTVVVKVSDPRHLTQTNFNSAAELAEARQYWTEMTERMQREVTALAQINHPNIVRVLAAGSISADLGYVVMELLRGKTLRDELNAQRQLPHAQAVAIASEVAAGLRIVHEHNIVHRDLTPRNIFLCEEIVDGGWRMADSQPNNPWSVNKENTGEKPAIRNPQSAIVKLIDFGIAKFPKSAGAQTYTQHAVMAGTPGYASPEQFQNLAVDHRADIYSLGVVLYEMLTGEKPFPGRTATEIALKQLSSEPIRPRTLAPEIPIRLEALILRALAKDPGTRQQSAEELLNELKAISARVEISLLTPVAAAAPLLLPLLPEPEPSASEVFAVLTGINAKEETQHPDEAVAAVPTPAPVFNSFVLEEEKKPVDKAKHKVMVAGIILFFLAAGWLIAKQSAPPFTAIQTALPEPQNSATIAIPTPTLRPEVTAPRNNSVATANTTTIANNAANTKPRSPAPEKIVAVAEPSAAHSKGKSHKDTIPAPMPKIRPTLAPTPVLAKVKMPTPVYKPQPSIMPQTEPTRPPEPMPAKIEPNETARVENRPENGRDDNEWKREVPRPIPTRSVEPARPRREEIPAAPKVISWQGQVYGSREVMLEMPGVPGMIDIPRDYRKKVGVIEPPSPSNGWKRAVLRVFGNGDVAMIVRWIPHRNSSTQRQELAHWEIEK